MVDQSERVTLILSILPIPNDLLKLRILTCLDFIPLNILKINQIQKIILILRECNKPLGGKLKKIE